MHLQAAGSCTGPLMPSAFAVRRKSTSQAVRDRRRSRDGHDAHHCTPWWRLPSAPPLETPHRSKHDQESAHHREGRIP